MNGHVLIIDSVATNRIVLKVKLLAAQYRVRPCASLLEARAIITGAVPDLILIDTSIATQEVLKFCKDMKADPHTCIVPIIATGGFVTPCERVEVLEAGADDVVSKPFDDHILQARIRSLLRAREARQELRMREDTRTALGFCEQATTFTPATRILVASQTGEVPPDISIISSHLSNSTIATAQIEKLLAGQNITTPTDLYVIDFRNGLRDDNTLFRLLSEMRARASTRHASILVLLPNHARHAAAMALDLGANDLVCRGVDQAELMHRCRTLVNAKQEADALRKTVRSSLEAAITDPLTGLFNRRYALPHLARLLKESRHSGRPFAVMVLDLDHFKSVNDTYGHAAGDHVLSQVAERLRGNLRAADLLARIGGEEFLVASPNCSIAQARIAAERLRGLISETPFQLKRTNDLVDVTVSVGVSLSNGEGDAEVSTTLEDLFNKADGALFAAKEGGRNKVSLCAA